MKAEIITIGDEILIGQIVDTNSAWMASKLNEIGWEVSRIHTIPDVEEDIVATLKSASERCEMILMTGGLGPTKDDVTKLALCDLFQCKLVLHQPTLDHISTAFKTMNKPLRDAHISQAMLPDQCTPLKNEYGTAPGMMFKLSTCKVISMPGVPYEMKGIMSSEVLPMMSNMGAEAIEHHTLVCANMPESVISEHLADIQSGLPKSVRLAYLPHFNFVRLRLTGRGKTREEVQTRILNVAEKIKQILGKVVIAEEDLKIEEIIGKLLVGKGQTVTFAESCTGGFVAQMITAIPGSSAYFPGSFVTYSYDNKTEILGVDADLLWREGAVSEEVVSTMCSSVLVKNRTDYALALSGIAGPGGGTADKPVGTVWIAVANRQQVFTKLYHLNGNRNQNIERSANLGLEMLRKLIVGELQTVSSTT